MEMEPPSSYQAAETMNTKELVFSQEPHAERRENMISRCYGGGDVSQQEVSQNSGLLDRPPYRRDRLSQ